MLVGGGRVTFTCSGIITITSTINISAHTLIDGSGQSVIISGGGAVRLMNVPVAISLNLNALTITGGVVGGFGNGGAIANSGSLTVTNSQFVSNRAFDGGAIANKGFLPLTSVVFDSNHADTSSGGAIRNSSVLDVEIIMRRSVVPSPTPGSC